MVCIKNNIFNLRITSFLLATIVTVSISFSFTGCNAKEIYIENTAEESFIEDKQRDNIAVYIFRDNKKILFAVYKEYDSAVNVAKELHNDNILCSIEIISDDELEEELNNYKDESYSRLKKID